jgi:predicted amidophosphoribosyltransferase
MSADQNRFLWPPGPLTEPHAPAPPPPGPRPTLLDLVETQFLGRTGVSFDRAARLSGWTPDPPHAYCRRCAGSVGPYEADGSGCPACRTKRLPWERALRLAPYTGDLRQAVLDLKFRAWRRTGDELGRRLGLMLADAIENAQIAPKEAILVPVPAHWTRRLRFGVDHTLVLARAASRASGVPVRRALGRRPGPSQLQVPVSARAANAARAFRPRRRAARTSASLVIVLDDVRTTGATLRAACRALRSGCPVERLWVMTAGVTPSRERLERPAGPGGHPASFAVVGEEEIAGKAAHR